LRGYCKAHPDEKGIETPSGWLPGDLLDCRIARPIPTKRELKRKRRSVATPNPRKDCKAHPDEKGIETPL